MKDNMVYEHLMSNAYQVYIEEGARQYIWKNGKTITIGFHIQESGCA